MLHLSPPSQRLQGLLQTQRLGGICHVLPIPVSTMTIGIFGTWDHQFNATEQALTDKIKNNPCYPFTIVKDVFVLEYLHENIWKGSLLLIASTIGTACYMNMEFGVCECSHEE
ncbi:uncharacterized protein LOC118370976 isoform X2 [Oncorhynchus keta]|uniref:uncharacterized protein LOC118370976 isoform X2 n=1 Tax=Oncorhynchus keta TaxID=8018 RepID=UPI00227B8D15|nr:uncharacterized protein LOC118370976 isoform X2 [Oncorhynchus keta]